MATFVGVTFGGAVSSPDPINCDPDVTVQVGDLVVVFQKWETVVGASDPVISSTGTLVASWLTGAARIAHTNGGLWVKTSYGIVTTGGSLALSVSTGTGRDFCRAQAVVLRPGSGPGFSLGTGSAAPKDSALNANSGGGAGCTAGSLTPDMRGAAVCFVGEFGGVTYTPGTDWTEAIDDGSYSEYRLIATGGAAITGNCTPDGEMDYLAQLLFFGDETMTPPAEDAPETLRVIRAAIRTN